MDKAHMRKYHEPGRVVLWADIPDELRDTLDQSPQPSVLEVNTV
jgi:hypothetical protein